MQHEPAGNSRRPLLQVTGVTKIFGTLRALDAIDLEVSRGEFFALLGASGSGKSTLLRVLAGLTAPDAGQVHLGGQDIGAVAPHARPINMMFQSYALFPHMTVAGNIGFGLRQEGRARREIADTVAEILQLVRLQGFEHRNPASLSGGERQRVALARCLVKRPQLLLLDEPLAALDKRLREETRHELVALQQKLDLTVIMVTHDQDEAMSLASRIGIMHQGRLVQTGAPRAVYQHPVSLDVARFVGSINLLHGQVTDSRNGQLLVRVPGLANPVAAPGMVLAKGTKITLGLRPEQVRLCPAAPENTGDIGSVGATIETLSYLGHRSFCRVRLANGTSWQVALDPAIEEPSLHAQDAVWLTWRTGDLLRFPEGAEK